MTQVFFDVGISLDGFIAGEHRGPKNPLGDGGVGVHQWVFKTATFLELIGAHGGERSSDDDVVRQVMGRAGAYVMGRRMFDEGEAGWPEAPPFHAPVFVLTHRAREPWVRKGGTTFHFVTDGLASAMAQARAAAGARDVRVSGGAATIHQCIDAGLIDEFTLHLAPVLLGSGLRLLDQIAPQRFPFEQVHVSHSPRVTHLSYKVVPQAQQ